MSLEASELDATILDETEAGFALTPRYTTMPAPGDKPWLYTTLPAPATGAQTPVTTTEADVSDNDLAYLQWHFDFLGDIETIWEEYSGAGVFVGVYDDGLEITHPDLAANYYADLEVVVDGVTLSPLQAALEGNPHGTAVAGLIAAVNNDTGTVGVAWGAKITGVNIFSGAADINNNYDGFLQAVSQAWKFDVINNSWGTFPGFWQDEETVSFDNQLIDYWFNAVETGRDGLGTIILKAAGNWNQNSNGDIAGATRATIAVGAYDDDGDASYYSSYGSNILVSAPTSGASGILYQKNNGLVTTDLTGIHYSGLQYGYNGLPDDDYTNGFGGTSGATPIVSGVVSLMLEANSNLGWRDVQNILAYSAREVGSGVGGLRHTDEDHDWQYNGADNWNGGGLHYSEDYGFGSVDAYNAVRMAEVWHLFNGPQASSNESSFKQDLLMPTYLIDGSITDITFNFGGADFEVEYVDVVLDLFHARPDDLQIYLISPDGTTSTLIDFELELYYTPDLQFGTFTFGANAFRGENGTGEWTLRIVDGWLEDDGLVLGASVTLHGSSSTVDQNDPSNDVYHYTDEIFTTIARDASRATLVDDDGGTDWLDLSTLAENINLRMYWTETSTAGGKAFLTLGETTVIENAITGDGNDRITGNSVNNVLYGMRGNDIIDGLGGDDTISGGAGNDTLTGGGGSDIFLFDRALDAVSNADVITDFSAEDDTIWLESSIFNALQIGVLSSTAFYVGAEAANASDRIVYDAATGELYYDADGYGGADAVMFATLANKPTGLTFADFVVVDTSNSIVTTAVDRDEVGETTSTSNPNPAVNGDGVHEIMGSEQSDNLNGKSANDTIYGLGGDDYINGNDGDDVIDGGAGHDTIVGGAGNDIIRGGTSPEYQGDEMYGGDGDDEIYGSDQANGAFGAVFGAVGDLVSGGAGNDKIYGFGGDDDILGDAGDDIIDGGDGNDRLNGGSGSDHLYGGLGRNAIIGEGSGSTEPGFDTVYFTGGFDDYVITGLPFDGDLAYSAYTLRLTRVSGLESGQFEITDLDAMTIEGLQFGDGTYIDLTVTPLVLLGGGASDAPVTLTANGFEIGAVVREATDVLVSDAGGDSGVDQLQYVVLDNITGDAQINSDRLSVLSVANLFSDLQAIRSNAEAFSGSITVNAAAGERELRLLTNGVTLDSGERITDDTATFVQLNNSSDGANWLNGAGVNDFNLSFASAETIEVWQSQFFAISWYIPNVTMIDFSGHFNDSGTAVANGSGITVIETALDDLALAGAGSTSDFQYIGGYSADVVQLGNLGTVTVNNDGTLGDDHNMLSGGGLRGSIELRDGADQIRILGDGAFKGGTIDGGTGGSDAEADLIRMTFGVAANIGNISDYISNFEILQLDVTSQSHTVDVANFDHMNTVAINGYAGAAGTNTVVMVDNSKVIIQAVNGDTNFGTVNLVGSHTELDLAFVDYWQQTHAYEGHEGSVPASTQGSGTIHVSDAAVVNITTDSRDDFVIGENQYGGAEAQYLPPVDSFAQTLVLDVATTVTLAGDTGWDFTSVGTDISHVTLLDASGVTSTGIIGGVKAAAQTSSAVHFIGGAGDDVFAGGSGSDILEGGEGNDIFDIDLGASDTVLGGAGADTVRSSVANLDLRNYTDVERATLTGTSNLSLTGDSFNNVLTGNAGDNAIDGGDGGDTAIFTGNFNEYQISEANGVITITDTLGRDGTDTLTNVEFWSFADGLRSVHPAAPSDLQVSNLTVMELAQTGSLIATITSTDDAGDTAIYTLVDDAGGRFTLVGNELRVTYDILFDYEQAASHDVTIRVTDLDGLYLEKTFTFDVTDVNPEYAIGRNDIDTDDVIWGGSGNDQLAGNGGNDTYRGNGGNDRINGGTNSGGLGNIAEYSGNRADYLITLSGATYTIKDLRQGSPDGTDKVQYVQTFRFNDVTLSADDLIAPSNQAPTVLIENLLPNLKENASTAQPIKIADIVINDDGIGTNRLSVTGRDAAMFQIIGMALFLKAGVLLDAATAAELEFAVAVDDDELAGSPDAVSATYTLGVEDVANYGVIGGTPSSERINGTSGDDVIIGNGGEDDMRGGKGNDTYIVDSAGDKVTEASRQGTDTVLASVSHKLASNVENLTLTGDGDINGTGNSSSNVIIGNDGSNILRGGSGNDTLDGGAGNDFIYGDSGNDTLRGGIGDDYLDGGSGKDNLDGGAGNDRLYGGSSSDALFGGDDNDYLDGGSSSDVLNGGLGADEMRGGSGDDTYYVDDVGDVMFEFRNQGTDTVYSSVGYGLGDNVERLYLTGSDAIDATGNARDNRIAGNEAANVLTGGAGKDYFIFNTALGNGNIDTVTDFSVKDDTIRLDNSVFVGVGRDGSLSSGAFFAGAVAHDASDRIIYDKDSGALYFDADGNGIGEQIQFAQIDANLALTYKDFYIV